MEDIYEIDLIYLDELLPKSEHQGKKNQKLVESKRFYGCIGVWIIVALIIIGSVNVKLLKDLDAKLTHVEQKKSNQTYEQLLGKHEIS